MGDCNYLCQTSIVNVLVFGVSALSFLTYALRRKNGKRTLAAFGFGVCLAAAVIYLANLLGYIPTPIPANVGRNLVLALGVFAFVVSVVIWRW